MTPAEQKLWTALRRKQLDGLRFRRQVAFESYVVDFACTEKRLIIEVDGDVHDDQVDYDEARTEHLEQYGYEVLRFRNDQVMNDLGTVLENIRSVSQSRNKMNGQFDNERQDPPPSGRPLGTREGTGEGASS